MVTSEPTEGDKMAAAGARAIGCCADDAWRGRFCDYHQGYADGYDEAADRALMPSSSIPAESLPAFLDASRAWELFRSSQDRRIYRHTSGARVFVPMRDAPDVEMLINVAATDIAAAEGRPVDDVLADLQRGW